MDFPQMLGGSYEAQSWTADCEETWNWYPEQAQSQNATHRLAMYPTPGVELVTQVTSGHGRAHKVALGREFAVIGNHLWEIDARSVATDRGDVGSDDKPATISHNGDYGNQLLITSADNAYIFDLLTNTLTQIAALNGKATMGGHLDGFFLVLDSATSTVYISLLADGLTWQTGLQFFQRSAMPDRWRSMQIAGRFIWMLGEETSEIWYNAGSLVPMALWPGAPIIHYGIAAPFSPAIIGSSIMWVAQTASGKKCVCVGSGTAAQPISTYPLETALYNYPEVEKAVGDAYSDQGHTFYLVGFDAAHVTWAIDQETKLWHKRGTWKSSAMRFDSWRPRFYAYAFGEHRMLDAQGRGIWRMSSDFATDIDGSYIRRVRRAPAIADGNRIVFYPSLELFMEPGVGTQTATDPPTACFSWVDEST